MSIFRKRSQSQFIPYAVKEPIITEFEKIVSRLILLEVTDIYLVIKALCDLDDFFSKHEQQFLNLILPEILIKNLMRLLVCLQNLFVKHKIILKLLAKLLSFENFVPLFEPFITELQILFDLFTTTKDDVIQEQTSYIISKLMGYDLVMKNVCYEDVYDKLCNLLENCTEIDVVFNCMKIFKTLISSAESQASVSKDCKLLFLSTRIKDRTYQEQIFDMLDILIETKLEGFFSQVFSTKLLKKIFSILMQPEWSDTQNRIMHILYKCAGIEDPIFVEMLYNHLTTFTTFALESTSCHALACVTLFAKYTNTKTACQLLVDEYLHHKLTEFFEINCELIEIKMCGILGNLCTRCDLSEDKYRDYYLSLFIDLIGRKRLCWKPYRQAALQPIHAFLSRNKLVARFYFEKGLFQLLKTAVRYHYELDKKCVRELLEVYEMLVKFNITYLQLILPQDIYEILLMLFKSCLDSNEGEHYISVCNIILYSFALKKFRDRFLRYTGFKVICSALSKYKQNVHLHLMEFIYLATSCEEFACALLHRDIINILISLIVDGNDVTSTKIQLAQSILNNLKRYGLMYKFNFFHTLGFNDHIDSFFMVSAGLPPANLSFKHENRLSRMKTVLVINMTNVDVPESLVIPTTTEEPQQETSDQQIFPLQSSALEQTSQPLKSTLSKISRDIKSLLSLPRSFSSKFQLLNQQFCRFSRQLSSTSLLNGRGMRCTFPMENFKDSEDALQSISLEQRTISFENRETIKDEINKESVKKSNRRTSKASTYKTSVSNRHSGTKDVTKKNQLITGGIRSNSTQDKRLSGHSNSGSAHSINRDITSEGVVYEEDDILSVVSEVEETKDDTECRSELIQKMKHVDRDEPLLFFIYEYKEIFEHRGHLSELVKWQKIAIYVNELYTPAGGYTDRKYHTHINIIKGIFKTSYLSLGYIRVGSICERAIMFKLICDSIYLPCELKKNPEHDEILWIEVPIYYENFELKIHPSCRRSGGSAVDKPGVHDRIGLKEYYNCVIDLIDNVGALYPIDSEAALKYHSPRIFEYESDDSASSTEF